MTGNNPWEEKNRRKKVDAIVAAFDGIILEAGEDPFNLGVIDAAIAKIRDATPAQWIDLAKRLRLANPPSATTVADVVKKYEERQEISVGARPVPSRARIEAEERCDNGGEQ